MTNEEYVEQLDRLVHAARVYWMLTEGIDFDTIGKTLAMADTLGPILEPTAYKGAIYGGRLDQQRDLVKLTKDFRASFARLQAGIRG